MVLGELIPLSFDKIMQTRSYTVIILGCKEKRFAIYTEPSVGRTLQLFLTGAETPRPLTHELISRLFLATEIRVMQVVINDLQDTVYFARLFFEQKSGEISHIIEMDARPSDCLILALKSNAPVFATKKVIDQAIAVED